MSLPSVPSLGLLQGPESSLLKFQLKVQDYGVFPAGLILGLVVFCVFFYLTSPSRKLPPGPRGYPIIGNLLELGSGQWIKFAEWQKTYGQFLLSLQYRPASASLLNPLGQVISSTLMQLVSQSSS